MYIMEYSWIAKKPAKSLKCLDFADFDDQRGICCFGHDGPGHLPPVVLVWL